MVSAGPPTPLRELHRADALISRAQMRRNDEHSFVKTIKDARDHLNAALALLEELRDRGTSPYPPPWVFGGEDASTPRWSPPEKPETERYGSCPTCGRTAWTNEVLAPSYSEGDST